MTKFVKAFHLYAGPRSRRRQMQSLCWAIGIGLVAAAAVAGILYWVYYGDRFRP